MERRTWRQVVELLTGVADGLATAHASGILHRDIARERAAKNGYAKLADFGLARLFDDVDTVTTAETMTRTARGGGTIAYMFRAGLRRPWAHAESSRSARSP